MSNTPKFSLRDIVFTKVSLDTSLAPEKGHFDFDFRTHGVLDIKEKEYYLTLQFYLFDDKDKQPNDNSFENFVFTELLGTFEFKEDITLDTIPDHFWSNSIAMVYPYIRSFLTSLVFQADIEKKFILPTLNLSWLGAELKGNTTIK